MSQETINQNAARDDGQSTAPMTHQEALAKVAKLLRLSQSDNPNEAALASSRAQAIMDRFKLTGGDISLEGKPEEKVAHFAHDPLELDGAARWKGQLACIIAKQNQCKAYKNGSALCLIGRPSDVQTVRYLYSWMVREVERLAGRDCAGCGRTYFNNYRLGAVETICNRLYAAATQTVADVKKEAVGERALMVVTQSLAVIERHKQEVEDYGTNVLKLRRGSSGRTNYHSGAREAGRKAGHEVSIGGARPHLGGGSLRLT